MKVLILLFFLSFIYSERVPKTVKICLKKKLGLIKAKGMITAYNYYRFSEKKKTFSDYVSLNYPDNIQVVKDCISQNPGTSETRKYKKYTKEEKYQREAKKILRNPTMKNAIISQLNISDTKAAKETCMSLVSKEICEIAVNNLTLTKTDNK